MQDRFLPWYHSSRPDSSEDTPESSSPRSFSVIGSLLNRNDMFIEKSNILFVCSIYRSLREKQCTKPDVFLNVLKYYSSLFCIEIPQSVRNMFKYGTFQVSCTITQKTLLRVSACHACQVTKLLTCLLRPLCPAYPFFRCVVLKQCQFSLSFYY